MSSLVNGPQAPTTGRRTHLIPQLEAPSKGKMAEYKNEDLIAMRQSLREAWLSEQLASFENDNKSHFYQEKASYIENLYRYLKKITKRWASWNHKAFGAITSRQQIKELLQWERSRGLGQYSGCTRNRGNSSSSEQDLEANALEKFEFFCECSQRLLATFRVDVHKPLTDFFADDKAMIALQDIPRSLEKCLQRWEALLKTTEIDERLFNKESEKEIFINGLRNRTNEFDIVLRIVPDLFEKHLEALRLARRWRLIVKAIDIKRRDTFTFPIPTTARLLKRREDIQRRTTSQITKNSVESTARSSDNEFLEKQLTKAEVKYTKAIDELEDAKAACSLYEDEICVYRKDYDQMKRDLHSMKDTCKELHERISESRLNQVSVEQPTISTNEYSRVLKKELGTAKMKYCSQRIKLLNAKKRVENLNAQLTYSQQKYEELEDEMTNTRAQCSKLEDKLSVSRRNLNTQGGIIDALQHQCKTLYDELEKTNGRCRSMEEDLNQSKKRYVELVTDVERRSSREDQLPTGNSFPKKAAKKSKEREQSAKKECMFPDIIRRGRSS